MAAAPPSYEAGNRRALRAALGVTASFMITQIWPWPLSFVATALTFLLLQDARPMPVLKGAGVVLASLAVLGLSLFAGFWLSAYPAVMVLTLGLGLWLMFRFLLRSGAPKLLMVALLLGATLIPVLTKLLTELGLIFVLYVGFDFVLAWIVAQFAFVLIPPPSRTPPQAPAEAMRDNDAVAADLALVVGLMLAVFLFSGRTDALTLVYTALFALSLSQAGAAEMGLSYLRANFVYGGLATLIVFEALTVVTFLPFAAALFCLAIYVFARNVFSHKANAAQWSSGAFGFIILLSMLLASDTVSSSGKILDRLLNIGKAALFVTLAFAVLDYLRRHRRARRAA